METRNCLNCARHGYCSVYEYILMAHNTFLQMVEDDTVADDIFDGIIRDIIAHECTEYVLSPEEEEE